MLRVLYLLADLPPWQEAHVSWLTQRIASLPDFILCLILCLCLLQLFAATKMFAYLFIISKGLVQPGLSVAACYRFKIVQRGCAAA